MDKEKWAPDHSISKGYPYDVVKSAEVYPSANRFTDEITLDTDDDTFVQIGENKFHNRKLVETVKSLMDCTCALAVAETQISDILEETPFVPEDFGFEAIHKPETIKDAPVRIWASKHEDKYSIYRKNGTQYEWVILKKRDDGTFDEIPCSLPCHRIAYALFSGLMIQVETHIVAMEAEMAPVQETETN